VNARLLTTILMRGGAAVVHAENGQEALERVEEAALRDSPFELILMDMQMPLLDGKAATVLLRRNGYCGPIMALTANASEKDREECLDCGCDDFLPKPIERSLLLARCALWMPQ